VNPPLLAVAPRVSPERECDYPWRGQERSLLTPDDHEAMLESTVAIVEVFELVGAVE
jgi:hypothetical protein